jgi:hypothetical protein
MKRKGHKGLISRYMYWHRKALVKAGKASWLPQYYSSVDAAFAKAGLI